ncbi:Lsr2 family protein [Arthrobacter oryzae]|uniref:histone-like nucleoid-structuring protein Lsr2 n=1 Tax=Arthrobacter oryzae TaxID=409290 RepID=UPI002181E4E4|nr:Lsr2 family protein [Arthrobacter oryzae]
MNHDRRILLARKVYVQLIDDLTGADAEETVRFSVDGVDYEIDLAAENAAGLRAALAPFIAHSRRVRSAPGNRSARTAPSGRDQTQKIREWAKANGYSPSSRGRISEDIKKAYDDAH